MLEAALAMAMLLCTLVGVAGIILGLPGGWLVALAGLAAQLLDPNPYSWWTILAAVLILGLGELIEFLAGALGSSAVGGGKAAAWGAIVGGLVGAIAGTILLAALPVVGTLIGSVLGAGLGAGLAELNREDRPGLKHAAKVFGGAAAGRLLAVVAKSACAGAAGVVLIIAALI